MCGTGENSGANVLGCVCVFQADDDVLRVSDLWESVEVFVRRRGGGGVGL